MRTGIFAQRWLQMCIGIAKSSLAPIWIRFVSARRMNFAHSTAAICPMYEVRKLQSCSALCKIHSRIYFRQRFINIFVASFRIIKTSTRVIRVTRRRANALLFFARMYVFNLSLSLSIPNAFRARLINEPIVLIKCVALRKELMD